MTNPNEEVLAYYAQPGPMTDSKEYAPLVESLPHDIAALTLTLQKLAVHVFWAKAYGLELSKEREEEVSIRPADRKLARLLEIDPRPLTEPRVAEQRLVCNCRDFSVLMVTFLRHQGIPARARCGFGTYFVPNHFEDHWVVEYWKAAEGRWVMLDAQLDDLQQKALNLDFDPLDMPPGKFVVAGEAWQMCRRGEANPDDFGIFDMRGMDFILGNLYREVLTFNKIELLPWDCWGALETPTARCTPEALALYDQAAVLSAQGSPDLRAFYKDHSGFHVPEKWIE